MEINTLRWFQLVVDGATVTEVAELHMVSQPGVSRALDRLEAEVGAPLLGRSGRVLRPTHVGSVFKRHVDTALHHIDDGLAAVNELVDPESGTVGLAFQLSLGTWLVPALIGSFRRIHPVVRFLLVDSDDARGSALRHEGYADLELTSRRPLDAGVDWAPLFVQPLVLAVPSTHRLADRQQVSLNEASQEEFVMLHSSWDLRSLTERLCADAGFSPRVAFEADDLPVVRGFVAAGLGVAVLPAGGLAPDGRREEREVHLPIVDPGAHRDIGISWAKERRLLPSAELFRRHVLTSARRRDLQTFQG